MTVRILCGGHRFALVDVNAVNYLAVAVNDVVLACLGAGIAAIQLHIYYLRKGNMCRFAAFIQRRLHQSDCNAADETDYEK